MTTLEKLEELIYIGFKETDRKFQETDRQFKDTDRKFQETDRKFQDTDRQFKETDRKFQETDRQFKETDRKFQETDRQFKDTDRKFQETDRKFQDTDRQFKETDRKFQETDRQFKETDRKFQETDRKFQDTDRMFQETDREICKVNKLVAHISDSLGMFAENMVAPALVKLFNKRGIMITDYTQRLRSQARRFEFDIVAFNTDYVVVVSVKMTLRVDDVKHFLQERLPIFKELFPRYKDLKVIGAVAGANIVQESDIYAMKHGLYVLAQSGDNIIMLNDDPFTAKIF